MSISGLNTNYGNQAYANSSAAKNCKSAYTQSLRKKINEKPAKEVDLSDTEKTEEVPLRKTDCIEISKEARLALEREAEPAREEEQSQSTDTEDDAEEVSESQGGKVAVNEGKRLRQIAAAATKEQVQQVLALLQKDMSDCKAGLEQGMCDETEIAKVEALLSQAKTRLNQVPSEADLEGFQGGMSAFELASLM